MSILLWVDVVMVPRSRIVVVVVAARRRRQLVVIVQAEVVAGSSFSPSQW